MTHNGAGTVTWNYAVRMSDTLGAGPVTNQAAVFVDTLTRGAANYVVYSGSTAVSSYHGGKFQVGTAPQISVAGFTTFGSILGHDASGNLISNPNLTIVNGTLTMADGTTAKVLATTVKLQLDGVGQVESLKPLKLPVYTVAGLPSAATAYMRCFVSDANATTFNSIVAGGGANKVPVFSDGSVWRIG
jgi:hypothetical protein